MRKFRVLAPVVPVALATVLVFSAMAARAAAVDGPVAVSDVRVGVHPGITRVVLDISAPARYTLDVSANGQAVMVKLPGADWRNGAFSARHLRGAIAEMHVVQDGELAILTDGPVHVKRAFALAPEGASGNRIVIDLADGLGGAPVPAASMAPVAEAATRPAPVRQVVYRPVPDSQSVPGNGIRVPPPAPQRYSQTAAAPAPQPQAMPPQNAAPTQHWGTPVPPPQPTTVAEAGPDDQMGQHMFGVTSVYARAQAGMGFLTDTNGGNSATTSADFGFDLGYVAGGAIGAKLGNGFRVEGEMNYASNDIGSLVGTVGGTAVNSGNATGDVSSLSMMGNLAYDFDIGAPVKPFVLGGLGLVRISVGNVSVGGATLADDTDWVLGYQFGGGFQYALTDQIGLEASYRFFDTFDPSFSDAAGTSFDLSYRSHQVLVGAYFKL